MVWPTADPAPHDAQLELVVTAPGAVCRLLHSFTAKLYRVPAVHELIGFVYWFATGNFLSER